jgi:protein TonB
LAKLAAQRLPHHPAKHAPAKHRGAPPPGAPAPQKQAPAAAPVATVAANAAGGAGGVTRDAVLTRAVAPAYPAVALRSRQSGWVVVDFTVDPEGRTRDITVVNAQPRRVFDNAAIDAVRRYRFTPAMSNGVAVATKRQQKIEFNL